MNRDRQRTAVTGRGWLASLLATAVVFGVLDGVWLGIVAGGHYRDALGPLAAEPANASAAALFYVVYCVGLTYFGTVEGVAARRVAPAALRGGMLGLVAYSTWDLTSLAVIDGFPVGIVPVDIAWGTVASALACGLAAAAVNRLGWGGSPRR